MNNITKKTKSFIIKTKLRDKDKRGSILSICDIPSKNVSIINCKKIQLDQTIITKKTTILCMW